MIILSIRTDRPEAEIGLFDDTSQLGYETWLAHRELSVTIHAKIETLLRKHKLGWRDIGGIICYEGPGSFTGLRIGLSVANALATSLRVPITAASGDDWLMVATSQLLNGNGQKVAMPKYGQEAHITQQKK